jgi:glycosyltransferase involved in cell wall biosynthesis
MRFSDWRRYFNAQEWDICVLVKGWFEVGDWALDGAARLRFGGFATIEHLTAEPLPAKTHRTHFGIFPGIGVWWYRERLRRFFRSAAPKKIICVSDAVRRRLTEDYLFPVKKAVTVRNGIDVQHFQRDAAAAKAWRNRWGIPQNAVVFGALGRFTQTKSYDTALIGFQAALRRFPEKDLRLVFVGEGPEEDALRKLAGEIAPAGRVVFSPFCDKPREPLSAVDVFLMPSRNEGLPLTLLEAMACGACPVATAVGGVPEVLTTPDLGWLVSSDDNEAFASAMIEAASQTAEQRANLGARARRHVAMNFNADVQFNALADVIESITPGLRVHATGKIVTSRPS